MCIKYTSIHLFLCAYQPHRFVVHVDVFLSQRNLLNLEGYTCKTQLPCNVHPPQFHVHSYYLHGSNTSEIKIGNETYTLGYFPLTICQTYGQSFFFYENNLQKEKCTCAPQPG